jgi:Hint domain-containing protein
VNKPGASNRLRRWSVLFLLLLVGAACSKQAAPTGPSKSLPALKLAVLKAAGGRLDYCDPDQYPVARGSDLDAARARFPSIQADSAAFQAILEYEHLTAGQEFTDAQLIAINNDYKQMQAIQLVPAGDGFRFDLLAPKANSQTANESVSGTVSRSGAVDITHRGAGKALPCPICLAAGVRIATPFGEVPVQDVRVGMAVWTTDGHGRRIVGVVLRTGHMQAPLGHEVIRLTLADGRTVTVSPGHPTADGRTIGQLRPGDAFDGSRVVASTPIGYSGSATYDLLPSGPTGTYFAGGLLLGSTLRSAARR